ncbi:DUF5004 domain-containing protein [Pseudopedobacter sp.]|uniref:DUF5004 domain-containing protein n=1 Tax=Pseudopedobacter sp. TaxID=1936787 RepID=UPI003340FDAA
MKTIRALLLLCLVSLFFLQFGCKKPDDGSYVDPITLYEKVKGEWKLNDISQVDETAKVAGISPDEISLFSQFGFENLTLSLQVDEKNNPTTYSVSGDAPELFPNSGYWDLSASFPAANGTAPVINLYSDQAKTDLQAQLSVVSVPGAKTEMELKLTRKSGGVAFVSYNYKLTNVQ